MTVKEKGFSRMLATAYIHAMNANMCSFDNENGREADRSCALSNAAACVALCSAARSLYLTMPEWDDPDMEQLFSDFEVFTDEVFSGHQFDMDLAHIDESFQKLKSSIDFISPNHYPKT